VLLLIAAAGTANAEPAPTASDATSDDIVSVANEGGSLEGHTPTAFAGMGTGLFAGDDLNPSFPEGVGVQTFLSFVVPSEVDIGRASIVSDALQVSGTPFEDLGPLLAEPVVYESFGPELFDLAATGPHTECTLTSRTSIECDATEALQATARDGRATVQFRLRFERPADNDGRPDLALFFRTDSNTNEAGLFELLITQHQ
jgi:hypothetical protein